MRSLFLSNIELRPPRGPTIDPPGAILLQLDLRVYGKAARAQPAITMLYEC